MPQNPNVQFGRSIKPVAIKDVQVGNIAKLYHKNSTNPRSANITVGVEPVVLVAFGLKEGETLEVRNVFGPHEIPYTMGGETAVMSLTNTVQVLPIGGIYCLYFNGTLGDLIVIAYKQSAMDDKTLNSVALTNPDGASKNRPNMFLDGRAGVTETHEFVIGTTPWVFRAFGLQDQVLQLFAVFETEQIQVTEDEPVTMSAGNSTLVVNIAGRYKFHVLGESEDIILAANPTVLNYYNSGITATPDEGGPVGVTYIGTGGGITGGPITNTGNIALAPEVWDSLYLADSAVQPGDNVSVLVNDAGYIDNDDIIDGGNF
jgi:hypothetical protein